MPSAYAFGRVVKKKRGAPGLCGDARLRSAPLLRGGRAFCSRAWRALLGCGRGVGVFGRAVVLRAEVLLCGRRSEWCLVGCGIPMGATARLRSVRGAAEKPLGNQ